MSEQIRFLKYEFSILTINTATATENEERDIKKQTSKVFTRFAGFALIYTTVFAWFGVVFFTGCANDLGPAAPVTNGTHNSNDTTTNMTVIIDSSWNSDSSWYDLQGQLHQRYSHDYYVGFTPSGKGWAKCSVAISLDEGATWNPSPNPLQVIDSGITSFVRCGTKSWVTFRVLGSGSQNIAFKFIGSQYWPDMISIAGGTFQMGSTNGRADEQPIHSVTISPFKISSTEITQGMYLTVIGTNPSYFKSGINYPVESVSWINAVLFCNALSKINGKDTIYQYSGTITSDVVIDYTKNGYRLPTESEWEYACRAGTTTDYYWGRNYPLLTQADTQAIDSNVVWYHNSNNHTWLVASKKSNAFGLYDMTGNVMEWCNDYDINYTAEAQIDPTGNVTKTCRMKRGWGYLIFLNPYEITENWLRSSCRYADYSELSGSDVGFRVVCRL